MIGGARASAALRLIIEGVEPLEAELGPDMATNGPESDGHATGAESLIARPIGRTPADREGGRLRFEVVVDGWRFEVTAEPAARALLRERAGRARQSGRHVREVVKAQIPGRVVRVWVAPGDRVEAGQRLVAVEAMKMENEIRSSRPGMVESVPVAVGQTVELGDELVVVS